MPKLASKNSDHLRPTNIPKKKPAMSEKKEQAIEKLTTELQAVKKCGGQATKQTQHFENKLSSIPSFQCETIFGSDLTQFLLPRSQDKYHLTKWNFALRAINRRIHRLTKLLKAKLKGYE